MPLIAAAILAYTSGLIAGFQESAPLAVVGGLTLAAVALVRRTIVPGAIGLAVAAGALVAATTRAAGDRCAAAASRDEEHLVTLADSAVPGALVRGALARCRVEVSLAVERGRAQAGSVVRVRGLPVPARRGWLVQRADVVEVQNAGWRARWLEWATASVDRAFPADAPLARALLVADMHTLAPEVRDRYAAAGLAHMLSISGLHVGIIALTLETLFQLLRVGRRAAIVASVAVVAAYIALIGAPEAAVRSAVMLGAVGASRLAQRPTSPWALLALGAAGPVFTPRSALDLGYQLSVVGVAALVAGGALVRRTFPRTLSGWRRTLAAGLVVSTVATVVSAPLVAWTFGRVSVVGPLTNLAAAPIMAVAQPMLFLGLLLAPVPPIAALVGDAVHPVLAAFDAVAAVGAAIPGAWMEIAPSPLVAVLGAAGSTSLVVACVSRFPERATVTGAAALAAMIWSGALPAGSGLTELHLLDVGQGDAVALRTAHGRWLLFDAGRAWSSGDAGRSVIVPYLARHRGALAAFVLSHPHTDHVGGAATVIAALHPARYIDGAFAGSADAYRASLLAARKAGVHWQRVHPGDSLAIDGVVVHFLAPDSAWTASLTDPNLASTIARVDVGRVRFLLVGDAERAEEDWLLARMSDSASTLRADVLKVGHHGSATSSSAEFLDAVQPRVALVSVGASNSYGHPNGAVLASLVARGAQVLRTDRLGTVVVATDGDRLFVEARGDRWEVARHAR